MTVLVLSRADVERLLPMRDCVDLMADALAGLARSEAYQPLRFLVRAPAAQGLLGLMPAYRSAATSDSAWGLKTICVYPQNSALGLDPHQGAVLLSDGETGRLRAIVNAGAVTAIRTAAVSAVATRTLAREDASAVAILGTGIQARSHLEAMAAVLPVLRVRLWGRNLERAQELARELSARHVFAIDAVPDPEGAVRDADVVCTTTAAAEPILAHGWLADGAHVNAVGSSIPTARELDAATIAASTLFVDSRESALNEAGDVILAQREGAIGPDHIRAELGELLIGREQGRTRPDELTVFKSLGLGIEDLAAAAYVERRGRAEGIGTEVEL